MPTIREWRSASAYTYLNELNPAELAWEFLRRNPDYQRDYRTAVEETTSEAEPAERLALRWGLRFSDRSGPSRK
jgi:Family of unknown function (DUF6499)